MGQPSGSLTSGDFLDKRRFWPSVAEALDSLRAEYDLVVIEGAGSPAEVNLRRGDIVNMGLALHAEAPVLLAGDIDNGGVFAHLVGTLALLRPRERALVRGFLINKFRGDIDLLRPGLDFLSRRTRRPVLGVIPYIDDLQVADEDAVALDRGASPALTRGGVGIAVARLPHVSNFDDFDPLAAEPGVRLWYARQPAELEGASLVVLPGTKNTRVDLRWLRQTGLAGALQAYRRNGGAVIGICGGFQMLGRSVEDRLGVEDEPGLDAGLGLLPVETSFYQTKRTLQVSGRVVASSGLLAGTRGESLTGYEIHMARTRSEDVAAPFAIDDAAGTRPDGAVSDDGRVIGTYLHGLFANDALRHALLRNLGHDGAGLVIWNPDAGIERLAAVAREHIDIDTVRRIAGF